QDEEGKSSMDGRHFVRGGGALSTPDRFLSQDACEALLERVVRLCPSGWEVSLHIYSRWSGNVRWARNEITTAGDITEPQVTITASHRRWSAYFQINRLDDASIQRAIAALQQW